MQHRIAAIVACTLVAACGGGDTQGALPVGARLRLKTSKTLSGYPAQVQNIFRAMQTHGLIVADDGRDLDQYPFKPL